MVEKHKDLESENKRKELVQNLLGNDFEELNYDNFAHFLKGIDSEYLQKRELWAKRLQKAEKLDLPDFNDRIFRLCDDARLAYTYGLPKATIMYLSQAAEQILKNIYLKHKNHSEESYKQIEGDNESKGKTFGVIINLVAQEKALMSNKSLKDSIQHFKKINSIRNKSAAHVKFVGLLSYEKDPLFSQFLLFLKDLQDNFNEIREYFNRKQENGIVIKKLIDNEDIELVTYQQTIEYEVDYVFAEKMLENISLIHESINLSLLDADKISKISKELQKND